MYDIYDTGNDKYVLLLGENEHSLMHTMRFLSN